MTRTLSTGTRPPRAPRRPPVQLHNIALVPASELASLKQWQDRAQRLSPGNTLVVVPSDNLHLRQMGQQIKTSLEQRGHRSLIAITSQRGS